MPLLRDQDQEDPANEPKHLYTFVTVQPNHYLGTANTIGLNYF